MQTDDMRGNREINTKKESPRVLPVLKCSISLFSREEKTACQFKSPVYGLPSILWLHLLSAIEVCDKL